MVRKGVKIKLNKIKFAEIVNLIHIYNIAILVNFNFAKSSQ